MTLIELLVYEICVISKMMSFAKFNRIMEILVYIRNNNGPNIDTWGTPQLISFVESI